MKPFLKWAGNKYRVLSHIRRALPDGGRLIEPFCGSCAVSLNIDRSAYVLNDSNADLIRLYDTLREHGTEFISYCRSLFTPETNAADVYYQLRDEYNASTDVAHKSALLLYLNRHGYNGLYRTNGRGEFNVPFGRYHKPYFPEREMLEFHARFRAVPFYNVDFETMMREAEPGDVVYCDPPYIPLSRTSNFTSYQAGGFSAESQMRLARVARELASRGVFVLISNHDTPLTRDVYQGASFVAFEVQRNISRDGGNRGRAKELLAIFRPQPVAPTAVRPHLFLKV
ncbi:Dam family site-specific DNA-(adenine-N6)-methyltransferase [Alicyclobacillus fastidiosus]|uniref:Site-specific DNA-methyltransferase (adenine-specific) n=1 Tax=Alicyclobacillus fastidiosus TaxID=392011 RepID=A0ABV5ALT8_9BACL|nr:Dam family site-specific DNA-(adenine-N6)-methyltransferase [Alicyclobacillus fastidiosus]WEH09241.1 Dam family site-specific DNA-(adenine-N6)-methyltransferase [Alicyclobacillus fastidiosus]